jgi:uncharacterized lipoprotein YddW (UPF0748 family)
MLSRAEAGKFNAIFVNIFAYGYAYYNSGLLEKHPDVAPGFDPLAHLIERAHARGIQVHAWLVAGPIGTADEAPGPILSRHPDWGMVSLDDEEIKWLNYNRPDVRQFIVDIALELVKNYNVDGIHFDYTRYPHDGWKWGFDEYSDQAFAEKYGYDLDLLRFPELPAYGTFAGNPLIVAGTAQVLAEFQAGRPAVLLNRYGAGEAIVFNWEADERQVAANSTMLSRSLMYLLGREGGVYILRSETNAAEYGYGDLESVSDWLNDLGWTASEVVEADIADLGADAVLVMPSVYRINAQAASDLAGFVERGGGVIFIDGPTLSITDPHIQAITGMRFRGRHFEERTALLPEGDHPIIPQREQRLDLKDYKVLEKQLNEFRKQDINEVLQETYRQVKELDADVLVTITIDWRHEVLAERHFLDWQAWLKGGYVDLIIPRAYVDQSTTFSSILTDWKALLRETDKVMLGLTVYDGGTRDTVKAPERILSEIDQAYARGSNGVILFDLEGFDDDLLEALANGAFSTATAGTQ